MWSYLIPRFLLPVILQERHDDWPRFLNRLPRSLNTWVSSALPIKLLGTELTEDHLDIPAPGKWVIAWPGGPLGIVHLGILGLLGYAFGVYGALVALPFLSYAAVTTKGGWHARFGTRYDYLDWYYTWFSGTIKNFNGVTVRDALRDLWRRIF